MCGLFGVRGSAHAAAVTHLGLYSLQHRGQESAGIISVDGDRRPHRLRAMGLVSDAFPPEHIERELPGGLAIGHTRYSTAGSTSLDNAQPLLVNFRGTAIGLAHNGNLTNATELRLELEDRGSIFTSTSDSEVLLHRLAAADADTPTERLAQALAGVEGAYALLVLIGDTLLAVRDPRGFRPLVMGSLDDGSTVFASETCALDIVGATSECEVKPGQIVTVDANGRSMFQALK